MIKKCGIMNVSGSRPLLFFSTTYFMYIGNAVDTVVHEHHAIQIVISFDGPIDIIQSGSITKLKAAIIDSDQEHECKTFQSPFILLNIDPESKIGSGLKKTYLDKQKIAALPIILSENFLVEIEPFLLNNIDSTSIYKLVQRFLLSLSHTTAIAISDDRVTKVLSLLNEPGKDIVKIKELADAIYISPGRLIHLFTDQVGIPIRKYVLWRKLLTTLHQLMETKNLTVAALDGGFYDSPHFNRTFKKMFGLSPSLLLQNSQIIQVYKE
ncbi:AraC family transcriptional regulator [Pedobacter cryoconitis]|uniref:AraC-like DNA-binding protein n=1 Tax=Pedobacter cryoconitis TaxID=188932 RepID=A0A7X0MH54_9SPHI|nr:helix-turn-helix domain-containing protein [Pedobacter cryoconitis]MBB6498784.1 AraC-like DNA-binding protein [Pedobacter cryoconitis]